MRVLEAHISTHRTRQVHKSHTNDLGKKKRPKKESCHGARSKKNDVAQGSHGYRHTRFP